MATTSFENRRESDPRSAARPKKPYAPPVIQEWGSLRELTHGPTLNIEDGNFTGSGGT